MPKLYEIFKVLKIQKRNYLRKYGRLKYPIKKVPNYAPEHYPLKEKMLRIVIWHFFLEI